MSQKLSAVILLTIVGLAFCAPTEDLSVQTLNNTQKPNVKAKGFFGDMVKAPFDIAKGGVNLGTDIAKKGVAVAEHAAGNAVDISLLPVRIIFGKWQSVHLTNAAPVKQKDYPYVVRIFKKNDASNKLCGGVIVSKEHVLTAAHCFDGQNANQEYFVENSNWKKPIKVAKVIKHGCYETYTMYDDLALLKLETELDDSVEIISLPESVQYNAEKVRKGIVLGTDAKSKKLVSLDVSVVSLGECSEYYTSVYSHQLCVINSKSNGCSAESGFPLIQTVNGTKILAGTASYTVEDCANSPSIYTRIDKYLNFIKKNINGEKFLARC